jgi:uncharacterized membrane protein YeaQ/YmgE (transglycosylase-associated protein family)
VKSLIWDEAQKIADKVPTVVTSSRRCSKAKGLGDVLLFSVRHAVLAPKFPLAYVEGIAATHLSMKQPATAVPCDLPFDCSGSDPKRTTRVNPSVSLQVNRCNMSIIGWILLGLISGFIASKIVNKTGEGFFLDIILGIVGAIVGGFIFTAVGASGITGFNIYSMVVAVIGAIVVLVIYHAVAGRRAY